MLSSKVVQTKTHAYPQPEGTLGESMIRASRRLGVDSSYGMFCQKEKNRFHHSVLVSIEVDSCVFCIVCLVL
jgi:hypothetical protein